MREKEREREREKGTMIKKETHSSERGRLGTVDLLIKVACFVKSKKYLNYQKQLI
jgi:hypothetical protein